jgi:hypothetical protein
MTAQLNFLRRQTARLVALALILILYGLTRLPEISTAERNELARDLHFKKLVLPEVPGPAQRTFRGVNPSLQHISAWVSSVGAAVAMQDLDGDGLPNDVCYVDTRTDQVIVAPVPGTPARYQPFTLDPGPALLDRNTMAPMGCLPGDLNEDGLMDLIVYYWGRTPLAFLKLKAGGANGQALGSKSYAVQEIVPGNERWYTNAATLADLDGDGHADLIIGNYYQDGGRVLDTQAREPDVMQHSMSRAFNGGHNRLLRWEGATVGATPSVRFRTIEGAIAGDEDGRYSNGWTLAVGAADLDGDLLPEIYYANDFGPDRLLHNRSKPGEFRFAPIEGSKGFTTPNSKIVGRDSFKGMGVDFGDLNGDGLPDICVSNIAADYALEESHLIFLSTGHTELMRQGIAPYVDRSEELGLARSGWGWDFKLGDFNNDGILEVLQATGFAKGQVNRWPELHELAMGNDQLLEHPGSWPRFQPGDTCLSCQGHNPFYMRARDGRYYDIAPELELDSNQISRGISTADVDGDGRLDFAVANQWEASYFYHNESTHTGEFLGLHLRLPVGGQELSATRVCPGHPNSNPPTRPAIGAQATVYLPDGRLLAAEVDGGNGHSGKRSSDLHFGLGSLPHDQPVKVVLRWRDSQGAVQKQVVQLSPGWYTVLLGRPEGESHECF